MLGNDVIDLGAEGTAAEVVHPRFDARVFTSDEREAIATASDADAAHPLRFRFWAAKEAAYKALRRLDAGVCFSPRRFQVTLHASGQGTVRHGERTLSLTLIERGDVLHAMAVAAGSPASRTLHAVERRIGDASREGVAVRRLACRTLAERLGLESERITVGRSGRMPVLLVDGHAADATLSLSHHGRFVAFACRLGDAVAAS